MPKAVWNGAVLAESDETIMLEGNHYFPVEALHTEFFVDSSHRSRCPWKGVADYYDIVVDGDTNRVRRVVLRRPECGRVRHQGTCCFLARRARRELAR